MTKQFQRELEKLRKRILELSEIVEESVYKAVEAVQKRDPQLAERVIQIDDEVDHMEIEIEEECLKILALHQPVAIDLRFIVAVLKMNNDLERISDQTAKIALKAKDLIRYPNLIVTVNFEPLAQITRTMFRDALNAMINMDSELAQKVRASDDTADEMKRQIRAYVIETLKKDPQNADIYIMLLGVARSLERIADLTTNIAEDVIYMIEGNIVRHQHVD